MSDAEAANTAAQALWEKGDIVGASKGFASALAMDPTLTTAATNAAAIQASAGDLVRAENTLRAAIAACEAAGRAEPLVSGASAGASVASDNAEVATLEDTAATSTHASPDANKWDKPKAAPAINYDERAALAWAHLAAVLLKSGKSGAAVCAARRAERLRGELTASDEEDFEDDTTGGQFCRICARPASNVCARCKKAASALDCGKEHQVAHWKLHKRHCNKKAATNKLT